jgi:MOSC domain-containing protein YiiM
MPDVYSIVFQPSKSEFEPPYRFNRVPIEQANLIANHGIEGDRKAGRNPKRQINIMSYETVEQLRQEGFKTDPGELGEQIILRGIDVESLQKGDRLQLGASAMVEVNFLREPCIWFEKIQGKSANTAEGKVGVLVTVIESGVVRVGDPVQVIKLEQPTTIES